jgi:putative metallohydrolase (TIGR04338 family)
VNDPQRERLYRAEDAALGGFGPRFRRWTEVVEWVDRVTTDPKWIDGFPEAPIEVHVERRSRSARSSVADPSSATIHLRDGSWDGPTVVHELAHLAAEDAGVDQHTEPGTTAAHGPRFAGVELELVRRFLGFHAYGALRNEFDRLGVRWEPA